MARRAVVSGGGTGIGLAVTRRLAAEGTDVVILGRRADVLDEAAAEVDEAVGDKRVTTIAADLIDPAQVADAAERITAGGAVDVVVNNAGGNFSGAGDSLADLASDLHADFDGNVLTAVLLTEALLPSITRPGGRIVLVSSIAGIRGGGTYGVAKAAMHGWMWGLAGRLAADGITVNAVAPGFVPETGFWSSRMTDDLWRSRVDPIPMNRPGTTDEVAAAIGYLADPAAGWTTGQILQVNGGTTLGRG